MKFKYDLPIIVFREDDVYIAQCIRWDIASQGGSIKKALDSLENVFVEQVVLDMENGKSPLQDTPIFKNMSNDDQYFKFWVVTYYNRFN